MSEPLHCTPWTRVPGLAADVRADGTTVGASSRFLQLLGHDRWLDRLAPASRDRLLRVLARPEDFRLVLEVRLHGASTTELDCAGWWAPAPQHHTCFLNRPDDAASEPEHRGAAQGPGPRDDTSDGPMPALQAQARIDELIAGLRAEKERAEAADRAKSVFLAAASHDLRQPIHALGLFLSALRVMAQTQNVAPDALLELCRRMQSSLDGLGQLLNMLLDVSRLDANAVQVVREPTHLDGLLDDMGQAFLPLAREKNLRLRVVPSSLWVDTDPTVLRRILSNLLSNALRCTSRGGVVLGCRRRGAEVEIQVWDSGIGIAEAQQALIFNEFYQVHQAEQGEVSHGEAHGLGLGLSIVQRSARLLDAPLHLCSRPGRGSMFSILLARCAARLIEHLPEPTLHPTASGLGVLVIDDDVQVLNAMQQLLRAWGHRAFCAASADDAVVIAATHPGEIDLLLSDHRLGGSVSAYDTIRTVQACLLRSVPTFVLTGDTSPQRIQEASTLGFPVLHKPVAAAVLHAILEVQATPPSSLA